MYKKRYLAVIAGGLALAAVAFAHDGEEITQTQTTQQTPRQELRAQVQTERQAVKTQIQTQREATRAKIQEERATLKTETQQKLQTIKTTTSEEREKIRAELKTSRDALHQNVKTMREETRTEAKQLRDDFRTKVQDAHERARIAAAHGRGLKMLNRYRAAIARFEHLIGRIEMRLEKLKARGVDVSSVIPMIEEAKNMKIEAEADLEALKAKYEELLKGENGKGIAEEARAIAKELKTKLQAFHAKLKEIARALRALTPPENDEDKDDDGDSNATTSDNTQ